MNQDTPSVKNQTLDQPRARVIAFYLPQYHPIPENDEFWGKGFTEWTNVTKAKPLFRGHEQPRLPGELGFYDLRVPEVREQQVTLAREAGIEGFCYWHYWFGNGKRALERVFTEVVESGSPDFPFCLGWANDSWTGRWHGMEDHTLFEQTYPGPSDHVAHFETMLPAFMDSRYIEVKGKKLFLIYRPDLIPDLDDFRNLWNQLAQKNDFEGFHFVANFNGWARGKWKEHAIDGYVPNSPLPETTAIPYGPLLRLCNRISQKIWKKNLNQLALNNPYLVYRRSYRKYVDAIPTDPVPDGEYPCVIPNWDNTPRSSRRGYLLTGSTPEEFGRHLDRSIQRIQHREADDRLLFLKSWNEWAEGNYVEPDRETGRKRLEILASRILAGNKFTTMPE